VVGRRHRRRNPAHRRAEPGLGAVFTLTCAVFYLSMGSLARRILDGRPALSRVIARGSGAAMIVLGLLLLAERLLAW
jgi:threonine/homoserine/homoserine lactone efflux protein